jgi:hypothetical protein
MPVSTPIQTLRQKIYDILSAAFPNIDVYRDGVPRIGVKIPSIAITHVSGSEYLTAMGRQIGGGGEGEAVRLRLQIDVFHTTQNNADDAAEKVMRAIFTNMGELRQIGVEKAQMIVCVDVAPEEEMARNEFRKLIDYEFILEYQPT